MNPIRKRIRVLVVDDSAVMRRLLCAVLDGATDVCVVGVATDGRHALELLPSVAPDLVLLDIEMPGMDGLATLDELRRRHPRLRVVMCSTLTTRGAAITVDALLRGANDCVAKPSGVANLPAAVESLRSVLLPRIRALCGMPEGAPAGGGAGRQADMASGGPTRPVPPGARRDSAPENPVEAVVIGSSTGGPAALERVLSRLPADLPAPVLVVQHMPALFTKLLADRLMLRSPLPVREASEGAAVVAGQVMLARGDWHLEVTRGEGGVHALLHQEAPRQFCRPSVDVLFESAVSVYGGGLLAVVLTGMGRDGTDGCRRIRDAGGRILVQDEATSVVWGMPGSVAQAGLADRVMPIDELGAEIVRRVRACGVATPARRKEMHAARHA